MKISAIKHKVCGDTIYSRTTHDFRSCSCGYPNSIAIDGGFEYMKISAHEGEYDFVELDIDVSKKTLYDDWNNSVDKYGLIKEKK